MPVHLGVHAGEEFYQWGHHGHQYPINGPGGKVQARRLAGRQGAAAHANGYRGGSSRGDTSRTRGDTSHTATKADTRGNITVTSTGPGASHINIKRGKGIFSDLLFGHPGAALGTVFKTVKENPELVEMAGKFLSKLKNGKGRKRGGMRHAKKCELAPGLCGTTGMGKKRGNGIGLGGIRA